LAYLAHYYKETLDYAIVDILDTKYPSSLGYMELIVEISKYCRVAHSTLSRHLKRLVGKEILYRREDRKYGPTFYSLTTKFKDSLDIQKKHYPANYLEKTFSLYPFNQSAISYSFKKGWFSAYKVIQEGKIFKK
jgi:DNA-binding transcriptional ArsR family regulator